MKDIIIFILGFVLFFYSVYSYMNDVKTTDLELTKENETVEKTFNGEYDRSGKELIIVVYTYDNVDQVTQSFINYNKESGKEKPYPVMKINGWSSFFRESKREPYWCAIHVVEPKTTDSEYMRTWGHEMFHCVYGSFHKRTKFVSNPK